MFRLLGQMTALEMGIERRLVCNRHRNDEVASPDSSGTYLISPPEMAADVYR